MAQSGNASRLKIILSDLFNSSTTPQATSEHLQATIDWLCHAHDVTGKKGVSLGYSLWRGWLPAYPETSGYIICTLLDYFNFSKKDDYLERAYMLADWEIEVQLECGAVQGGSVADPAIPCVFNTGQVILGWVRAYMESENKLFLEAARRAGDWLVSIQDEDGAWRQHVYGNITHTYNTRTAWGLGELYVATRKKTYLEAAQKNVLWAIEQMQPNGWFAQNSFMPQEHPLIHNIAYAIRGIMELGFCLNQGLYVKEARKSADALRDIQEKENRLGFRYDDQWENSGKSICLVGCAQMAVIWFKLYKMTKDTSYLAAGKKANNFLKTTQNLTSTNTGVRGGVKGSQPIYGMYQQYRYPNWAAKFFADALLIEEQIDNKQSASNAQK